MLSEVFYIIEVDEFDEKLIFIVGTMGGKTATSSLLKQKLNQTVFLDSDWC